MTRRASPGGIWARPRARGRIVYVIYYQAPDGRQIRETIGTNRQRAERELAKRRRAIEAGTWQPPASQAEPHTLDELAEPWLAGREGTRSGRDDRGRYERYISPVLGGRAIDTIRPVDVAQLVEGLKRDTTLAANTVRTIHSVLSGLLEHARFSEIIDSNPARHLPRGTLPRKGSRQVQPYSRAEVVRLLTSPDVPPDHLALLALCALGGLRLGEACGRRWRDLDTQAPGLWCMVVSTQYDDAPLKGAEDEHTATRYVPVHPVLREILTAWWVTGWEARYGRRPDAGDLISPDPRTMGARTTSQSGQALDRTLAAIGVTKVPRRRVHALRASFISFARSDGAREDVLERITHNARGTVVDGYTYFGWEALCESVRALRVDLAGPTVDARALGGAGWDAPEHARALPGQRGGQDDPGSQPVGAGTHHRTEEVTHALAGNASSPSEPRSGISPIHHQGSEGSRILAPETGLEPESAKALSSNLGDLTDVDGPEGDRQKPGDPDATTQSIADGDRWPLPRRRTLSREKIARREVREAPGD